MKKIIVSILVIGLLLSTANLTIAEMGQGNIIEYDFMSYPNELEFVPGELIVKFIEKATVTISESLEGIMMTGIESVDALNMKFNVVSAEKLLEDDSHLITSYLSNIYKFIFDENTNIITVLENYSNDPNVEIVEPNYIYGLLSIPNDEYFYMQYALHNTGQMGGTFDADIDAPEAWDDETGEDDVIIAILDTGVDCEHPDLEGNLEYSIIDSDWNGHGTHCAGIAAAVTNNGIGIAGIAGDCKIMPRVCIGPYGITTLFAVIYGIINATNSGADVISMSFGGPSSNLFVHSLNYANLKGVVLVAGAGNDDSYKLLYPAAYDNVISVAATDNNDDRAFFSSYGSSVDVAAPGVDILSLRANGTDMYGDGTHIVGEEYYIASGTSMSCPHVAGVVALLLSQNPLLTPREVRTIIRSSTDAVNSDKYIGTGRINANTVLQKAAHVVAGLRGTAKGLLFQEYVVEYGKGIYPEEDDWVEIGGASTRVYGGELTSWVTTGLDEGLYTLRLTVISGGQTYVDMMTIRVDNAAETYYVDDDFTPGDPLWEDLNFSKISNAIDQYGNKDTIYVYNGTYNEHFAVGVDRSVNLIGENKDTTIIDNTNTPGYNPISISYGSISISGFTIKSKLSYAYSIDANAASNCEISGNKFIDGKGILLFGFFEISSDNVISGNTFIDGLIEIAMLGRRNIISDNTVNGISLGPRSNNNDIYDNTILDNGIELYAASFNNIYDNTISNSNYGIYIDGGFFPSTLNHISKNTITNNDYGIYLFGNTKLNVISENEISNNQYGIVIESPVANYSEIFYNNFLNNGQNAYDEGNNIWYRLLTLEGNYWDDYEEKYPNANPRSLRPWIWDTPYDIDGGDNQDQYPLMDEHSSSQSSPSSNPQSQPSSQQSTPRSTPSSSPTNS